MGVQHSSLTTCGLPTRAFGILSANGRPTHQGRTQKIFLAAYFPMRPCCLPTAHIPMRLELWHNGREASQVPVASTRIPNYTSTRTHARHSKDPNLPLESKCAQPLQPLFFRRLFLLLEAVGGCGGPLCRAGVFFVLSPSCLFCEGLIPC